MSLPAIPVPAKGQQPTYLTPAQIKKNRALFLKEKGVNDKINKLSSKLGVSVDEILLAIQKETGGSFSPQQKNLGGGAAVGLIQFLGTDGDAGKGGKTINGKFYKSSDLEAMTTLEQLDVVGEYFQENFTAKKGKPGQLYLSIAAPTKVGQDPSSIGYAAGSEEALANPSWQQPDGSVTLQSIMDFGGKPEFSKYTPSDANTPASGPKNQPNNFVETDEDYEAPLSEAEQRKQQATNGINLIRKSKEFFNSFKNTTLSEEDAAKVDDALVSYLQEFNETLPSSGFGSRDKKLGRKGHGFHKKYGDGLMNLGNQLTEGLDPNNPADWGKMAAIRRRLQANGKTEEFAKKALGDDFGGWGAMDTSLEYVMTERGEFDWSFGSYHKDKKVADHYSIPKSLRLKINADPYVQSISKKVKHANEIFDSKDTNPLHQAPIYALASNNIAKAINQEITGKAFTFNDKSNIADISSQLSTPTGENIGAEGEVTDTESSDEVINNILEQEEVDINGNIIPSITKKPTNLDFIEGQDNKSLTVDTEEATNNVVTENTEDTGDNLEGLQESFLDKIGGVSSLIGIATGAIGLGQALKDVDIPKDPKLGPAFQQRLEESKNLAQQGLTPTELAQAHKELDSSYSKGIENIVRGSAGNRAQFMAGLGGLDVARQSALMDISVADAKMQRENQQKYDSLMQFNEQYEAGRESRYLDRKYQEEQLNKQSGAQLAGAALSAVNQAIGDRDLNQLRKIQTEKMMRDMGYKSNSKGKSGQDKFGGNTLNELKGLGDQISSLLATGANKVSGLIKGAKNSIDKNEIIPSITKNSILTNQPQQLIKQPSNPNPNNTQIMGGSYQQNTAPSNSSLIEDTEFDAQKAFEVSRFKNAKGGFDFTTGYDNSGSGLFDFNKNF